MIKANDIVWVYAYEAYEERYLPANAIEIRVHFTVHMQIFAVAPHKPYTRDHK